MPSDSNQTERVHGGGSGSTPPPVPDHELLRFIASGSFGSVWLARNIMGTFRAVKVVYRANFKTDHDYEREFNGIQKFEPVSRTHNDLIDILQVGRNDEAGYFYYVMEVADDLDSGQQINPDTYQAKTLDQELTRRRRLPFEECLHLGLSVADGLRHLNDHGLIHRDIKPANIIYINGIPKIADIGLVTEVGQSRSFVGTPGFMAPEGPWTVQADIYSLGKVLYETAFGKDREAFPAMPTQWPAFEDQERLLELNEIITKACDSDVRRRYQSAAKMHADLVALQGGQSVKRLRTLERRWAVVKVACLIALPVLALIVTALFLARRAERQATRRLADSYVTVGAQAMAQEDLIGSLPWFTEALRLNLQAGDADRVTNNRVRIGSVLRQSPKVVQMWFQDSPVRAVEVSPDGRHVAAGDDAGHVNILDIASGARIAQLTGHSTSVVSVAYSPDGRRIATASHDKSARVWDAVDGRMLAELPHPKEVQSARFSPDGAYILTTAWDDMVRRFDAVSGRLAGRPFTNSAAALNYAVFDPHGERVLTASLEGKTAWIMNSLTGRPVKPFKHEDYIFQAVFSPDGLRVATASFDKTAAIWDVQTGFQLHKLKHPKHVRSVRFSPDGRFVLTACDDFTARLWNVRTGEEASPPLKHSGYLYGAVFCPDGRRIVTGTAHGIVSVWDLSPNDWLPMPTPALFSANGNRSLTIQSNIVQIRDAASGGMMGSFLVTNFPIAEIRLNDDGSRCLVISPPLTRTETTNRLAQLWSWEGAGFSSSAPFSCNDSITNSALSADGLKLTAFLGKVAELRDTRTGVASSPPLSHENNVSMALWDSKAGVVLTVSGNTVNLWDPKSGGRRTLPHDGAVNYANISPDGRYAVSCCCHDTELIPLYATLWKLDTLESSRLYHGDGVTHAAFSRDSERIVTSSEDKSARIWKVNGQANPREPVRVLEHGGQVFAGTFSSDGRWVATADRDGTGRVWEVENGKPLTPRLPLPWGSANTRVQFIGGERGILFNRWEVGERATVSLPSDSNRVETLERMAQIFSGHRSDRMGSALPLEKETLKAAWINLAGSVPARLDDPPQALVRWHERQLTASTRERDWFAARFHMERLGQLLPNDPDIKSQRDKAREELKEQSKP